MAMSTTKKKEEGPRSFGVMISGLADGRANSQISEALHDLVKAGNAEALARDADVNGELTLKLKLKFTPRGIVGLAYDVKSKAPPKRTASAHMFVTEGGNLSPQDERQPELPNLRAVKLEDRELREAHSLGEEG